MSTTANSQPEHDDQAHAPLPLPPPQEDGAHKLNIGSEMKFDTLGPLVVNSDGTLSRIANWANLTAMEQKRIVRVLSARNKIRIADQEAKLEQEENLTPEGGE